MRRIYSRPGLVRAMEEDKLIDNGEDGGNIPAADVVGIDTSIQMEEVQAASLEAEELETQMDTGAAAAEGLEEVRDVVEGAGEEGGMDRTAAAAAEVAVEALCVMADIASSRLRYPAVEQFGGRSGRGAANKLAVESIGQALKDIWQAIIDGLKKAWKWCKDQYAKYFGAAESLKKRAEKVAEAAGNLTGKAEKKAIEDAALFKKLYIGAEVKTEGAAQIKDLSEKLKSQVGDAVNTEGETIVAALADVEGKTLDKFKLDDNPFKAICDQAAPNGYDPRTYAPEGTTLAASHELPGGRVILAVVPAASTAPGIASLEAAGKLRVMVEAFNPKASAPTKDSLPVLERGKIQEVASNIADMAGNIVAFRKVAEAAEATLDKAVKAAEKAADAGIKESDSAPAAAAGPTPAAGTTKDKAFFTAIRNNASRLPSWLVGGPQKITKEFLVIGKAYLDYAEKCLAEYK